MTITVDIKPQLVYNNSNKRASGYVPSVVPPRNYWLGRFRSFLLLKQMFYLLQVFFAQFPPNKLPPIFIFVFFHNHWANVCFSLVRWVWVYWQWNIIFSPSSWFMSYTDTKQNVALLCKNVVWVFACFVWVVVTKIISNNDSWAYVFLSGLSAPKTLVFLVLVFHMYEYIIS